MSDLAQSTLKPIKKPFPRKCIHVKPNARSPLFCGYFISLPALHLATGIGMSHLSLIFSGKRRPSLKTANIIAHGLHMGLEEFLLGLDMEIATRKRYPIEGGQQRKLRKAMVEKSMEKHIPVTTNK